MNLLSIQQYLLEHDLKTLEQDHGIIAHWSKDNPSKFSLNYRQFETKNSDILAKDCRGLILKRNNIYTNRNNIGLTTILAYPMRRFFNYGDPECDHLDLSTTVFTEKIDGSLIIVYWDPDSSKFCIATRSIPDADKELDNYSELTYGKLFKDVYNKKSGKQFDDEAIYEFDKEYTYCFELVTPWNKNVVHYKDETIYLLALRNLKDGKEYAIRQLENWYKVPEVRYCNYQDLNSIKKWVDSRSAHEYEGLVACDSHFNRMKIKSAEYFELAKLLDKKSLTTRKLLNMIIEEAYGGNNCIYSVFNDIKIAEDTIASLKEKLDSLLNNIEKEYQIHYTTDRKEFAVSLVDSKYFDFCISMYKNKNLSVRDWLRQQWDLEKKHNHTRVFVDNLLKLM
ncbi:MAG: T4 RnlA family RNA ligase [Melioribacteraceae bacterium]|jgi:hypothetical protein|nr:T4 RnlA family RNA ligase [Melioribacteraceae bacterium]MDD3982804.1 RNA ligase [Candidatus Omnitrophota bacterium]